MIEVELVKINVHVPEDEVRIVAMQPFIRLHSPLQEPFQWSADATESQLDSIRKTLEIAENFDEGRSTSFTVFPEYSIPGVRGASIINERISLNDWPNESIVIAGIQGIDKNEYIELFEILGANISSSNVPDNVPNDKWVNCCVIWVKDHNGVVSKWIQLKIKPAWPELNVSYKDMFCGTKVFVFECQYMPSSYPCRFVTFICFDWVASVAGSTVMHELLTKLNSLFTQSQPALDWVFVIQYNKLPNHPSFLNNSYTFLTDPNFPFVQRDKAILIHVNSAATLQPAGSGEHGFSSCIFSPVAPLDCSGIRPTVCMQPKKLRKSDILNRCKDVVFREMGECIHTFNVNVPRFVTPDSTNRVIPLSKAHVYATQPSTDPRLIGNSVPASVKWINDNLDIVEKLSTNELINCPLKIKAEEVELTIIEYMRRVDGPTAHNSVSWAACSYLKGNKLNNEDHYSNSDFWDVDETEAIRHVLHSLTSIGLAFDLEFNGTELHAAIHKKEALVQIVAIKGNDYQDCRLHYDTMIQYHGTDPVLVIARDRDNLTPTTEEYTKFYESKETSNFKLIDYQTLISYSRKATDSTTLKNLIDEYIPYQKRFI